MGVVRKTRRRGRTRISAKNQAKTLAGYAGRLTGVYPKGTLQKLRREWR